MRVPGVGQRAHTVTRACRSMQVDERRLAAGQRITVGHAHHRTFVKAEYVLKVFREALQERQFVGAGVAKDGGHAVAAQ